MLPSSFPSHQDEWASPYWDLFLYIPLILSCLIQISPIGKEEKYA